MNNWKTEALNLAKQGVSWRGISRQLHVPKSSVSDFLREHFNQKKSDNSKKKHVGPKILFLDVEVAPSITLAFTRFKAFASPDHVIQEPYMLTFVVKWAHEDITRGHTLLDTSHATLQDDSELVSTLWDYVDEADIIVAQNIRFDKGWFNQQCIRAGLNPPRPYKLIDTLQMMKKNMSLPSNSLGAAAKFFNLTRKRGNDGITLWHRCMEGEKEAFVEMLEYNDGDVVTLEELYNALQPWCPELPNMSLYYKGSKMRCCGCGSEDVNVVEDSVAHTALSSFDLYRCSSCGKYSRGRVNKRSKEEMQNTLTTIQYK